MVADFSDKPNCPVCDSNNLVEDELAAWALNLLSKHGVLCCKDCKHRLLWPRPSSEEYLRMYSGPNSPLENEYGGFPSKYEEVILQREFAYNRVIETIGRQLGSLNGLSWLDIGANDGLLLDMAKKHGCKTYGIEPSLSASQVATDKGHNVFCGTYLDFFKNNPSLAIDCFDIVTANHVVEHIEDVSDFFNRVNSCLRDEGVLIWAVPNQFENPIFKRDKMLCRLKQNQRSLYSIHHLHFFNPKNARKISEANGFDVYKQHNHFPRGRKGLASIPGNITKGVGILLGLGGIDFELYCYKKKPFPRRGAP